MSVNPMLIFIAGPTASGKSSLAIELAKMLNGEIINADAIQVYQDLQVLSARPSEEEMNDIPHHLFGYMSGAKRCSAGIWARQAGPVVEDILGRGKTAILVGGTGLYFRAIEEGLSPIPDVAPKVMEETTALWEKSQPGAFYDMLIERDPAMAHLNRADGHRLMRAWSVLQAAGKPLSYYQSLPREPVLTVPVSAKFVVCPPREILYKRCEQRFDQMMASGALNEAKALLEREVDRGLPVMKSLGAAELMAHLREELTLEEAVELAKRNTRRFAKRQMTWLRGQASEWEWVENAQDGLDISERFLKE